MDPKLPNIDPKLADAYNRVMNTPTMPSTAQTTASPINSQPLMQPPPPIQQSTDFSQPQMINQSTPPSPPNPFPQPNTTPSMTPIPEPARFEPMQSSNPANIQPIMQPPPLQQPTSYAQPQASVMQPPPPLEQPPSSFPQPILTPPTMTMPETQTNLNSAPTPILSEPEPTPTSFEPISKNAQQIQTSDQPTFQENYPTQSFSANTIPGVSSTMAFNANNDRKNQGTTVVKKRGFNFMPIVVGMGIIVLLTVYTFVWITVFNLQIPFLPEF